MLLGWYSPRVFCRDGSQIGLIDGGEQPLVVLGQHEVLLGDSREDGVDAEPLLHHHVRRDLARAHAAPRRRRRTLRYPQRQGLKIKFLLGFIGYMVDGWMILHFCCPIKGVQRWQKRNVNFVKQQLPGLACCC